jgi:hypothetical protein
MCCTRSEPGMQSSRVKSKKRSGLTGAHDGDRRKGRSQI